MGNLSPSPLLPGESAVVGRESRVTAVQLIETPPEPVRQRYEQGTRQPMWQSAGEALVKTDRYHAADGGHGIALRNDFHMRKLLQQ